MSRHPSPTAGADAARIEVKCPSCSEKYHVKPSPASQRGASFTCRFCAARIVLPVREETTEKARGAGPTLVRGEAARLETLEPVRLSLGASTGGRADAPEPLTTGPASTGHGLAQIPAPAGAPSDAPAPVVVCPRCNHSFAPGPPAQVAFAPTHGKPALKTILIAEDAEFFLQYTKELLEPRYRPLTARTASEALRLLREERVDLVIADLALEKEDDSAEILKAAAARRIPCLIFTARQESDLWGEGWERLRRLGASDLLMKGVNIEEQLLGKVEDLLSPSKPRS